jgi:paraquat-inducible protein B
LSKKANPTVIGTFVIMAIGLALAAIIALGNIKFNDKPFHCVLYFPGSLHGLDQGAPVAFRGVQIGKVKGIRLSFDNKLNDYTIPVYVEITENDEDNVPTWDVAASRETARLLIKRGLRAKLKMRSIVTGKLYIDLAFYPQSPIHLQNKPADSAYLEIPTLPSGLEQITQTIADLPLTELVDKVTLVLDGLDNLLNSNQSKQGIKHLYSSLENIHSITAEAHSELPVITTKLKDSLSAITQLSSAGTSLFSTTEASLEPILDDFGQTLAGINQAIEVLTIAIGDVQELVDEDSNFSYDLSRVAHQVEAAAQSIQMLSDYLQRYPNALIFGKPETTP